MSDNLPGILVLVAKNKKNCAVSDFTKCLTEGVLRAEQNRANTFVLTPTRNLWRNYWKALSLNRFVLVNLPVVDWKKQLFSPPIAFFLARLRHRNTILVLHEWASLNLFRRLTYIPMLLLARHIVMMSALVRSELAAVPLLGRLATKISVIPLPPNLERPGHTENSAALEKIKKAQGEGKIIIAQFGSIYPGKQPKTFLSTGRVLKNRGEKTLLVLIGSFVKDINNSEDDFWKSVKVEGLEEDVLVTGFVDTMEQLYGLFEEVDVFVYPFREGMSARRSSVLATVQAGRPVVTTEPVIKTEFDNHPRLLKLIRQGIIHFVPHDITAPALADAVMLVKEVETRKLDLDVTGWWDETVLALYNAIEER